MHHMGDTGALRDFLQAQMRSRNWTQKQLAVRMGLSESALTRWLAGQSQPDVAKLRIAASRMGWNLDDLLVMAGHRAGDTPAPSLQEDLCARLRTIRLTPERYQTFEVLIERYAMTDQEQTRSAQSASR